MTQVSFETIHSANYTKALEAAKKFVSKSNLRVALQMVLHKENGDMIATDSHHLIRIKEAHGFEENLLVNPKSFEVAKGMFPETEHLFQQETNFSIELNREQIQTWASMFKAITKFKSKQHKWDNVRMGLSENKISFDLVKQNIRFELPYSSKEKKGDIERITFSAELFLHAIEAHRLLESESLTIMISSPMRAFILDNNKNVFTAVLPVREY